MGLATSFLPNYYVENPDIINKKLVYFLMFLFFGLSLIGILNHELWLDEAHHWLLGRDSTNLVDLITNTRYEGHPILWNILIFFISRFTHNPFWMQFLHILISTLAVFIFLRKAPFYWLFKVLFIFGYFIFFEYNIISRNYSLGLLFLFLASSIFAKRDKQFTLLCIYLGLAMNTHLIFAVIALALFLAFLFENYLQSNVTRRLFSTGSLVFFAFTVICLLQVIPPSDTTYFDKFEKVTTIQKFVPGFLSLYKGIIPIPDFRTIHFWNSNLLVNLSKPLTILLGLIAYLLPLSIFNHRKISLFFVYISLLGTQIFFLLTQLSATRYFGLTFIIIIIGLWLNYHKDYDGTSSKIISPMRKKLVYFTLIIHFLTGLYAYSIDIIYPFSTGKSAEYILKENHLEGHAVVTVFCDGTIYSPYLDKKIYFLCENGYKSFCNFHKKIICDFSDEAIISKLSELKISDHIIFIHKENLFGNLKDNAWNSVNNIFDVKPIAPLGLSIQGNLQDYYVFEIKYKP